MLGYYGHELMRSNPGSTFKISVSVNPDCTTTFQRMYTCFKAISNGWKLGCRGVIGLDGSFLKGQCKGKMLTAIGRHANNHVYPIAWVIVDIENKANWKWFLELIDVDLVLHGGRGMCVISDQHKGLLEATKDILPHVEHRQCARHIYANFRKVYGGIVFKNIFWAIAKSTVEGYFKMNMEKIKEINPYAYDHLMAREPRSWCRAFFCTGLACEAVENGMSECFNAIIIDARKKPLLTMLEEIRLYMMAMFYNLKETVEKWETEVCPAAIRKMEEFGEDLRLWDVSEIPCVHAQASILYTQHDPVAFMSSWFGKDKFLATYESNILPVSGSNLWEKTPYTKPFPPIGRRMPGRPGIKGKRHVSEHEDKHSYAHLRAELSSVRIFYKGGTIRYPARIPQLHLNIIQKR